jgi:hypothetical protein
MTTKTKLSVAAAALSGLLAGAGVSQAATTTVAARPASSGTSTVGATTAVQRVVTAYAGARGMDATTQPGKHDCKGKNACKGQGGCEGSDNGCKGKNTCKGKGGCNTMEDKGGQKK